MIIVLKIKHYKVAQVFKYSYYQVERLIIVAACIKRATLVVKVIIYINWFVILGRNTDQKEQNAMRMI